MTARAHHPDAPASRRGGFPWRSVAWAGAVAIGANLVAYFALRAVGAEGDRRLHDLAAAFVIAAAAALWVAWTARRAGESARPWLVFGVVWAGLALLSRAADWLNGAA